LPVIEKTMRRLPNVQVGNAPPLREAHDGDCGHRYFGREGTTAFSGELEGYSTILTFSKIVHLLNE